MPPLQPLLWAPQAWIDQGHGGQWHTGVVLHVGSDGHWSAIQPGVAVPPADARVLAGPVLPGLVNAHSHAFQRAFAGLAERREGEADDFWSWRDRMYRVALRISPAQLQAVAAELYSELLRGGYTQVCEFHYLQHQPDGSPYADPLALSWALADAAQATGIGLTMLPVLYQRAGFAQATLREDQRRFATTPAAVWHARQALQQARRPLLNAGIAVHSLRAASRKSIAELQRLSEGMDDGPLHIHIAEQTQEVDDCRAANGARPIEWLCREFTLDARWQLVHATHALPSEIEAVARSGAGVVICPSTEGNLGDGFADLPSWLGAGVPMSIGSDSHVTRAWPEELRWLEYGQRLLKRQRNVAAAPVEGHPATASRLFDAALAGGAAAAGFASWGLEVGARADLLVLDPQDSALLGLPPERTLDALVFSSPCDAVREVYVAGRRVVHERRHWQHEALHTGFDSAMQALWAPADA
ncbi:formimidoylglutamate deiminase [Ideonella sp. BN130291]|uniref:formimidoylglutamate deiminase n=1 Tax=Ideonella sp. BN130291 TaxID=3112940 RepID=UPI002E270435|nr:formimidoylglutamate deiminase [Ideonella sp. BN130291]